MKILRAIGHFFAKIGRWIANTAWVQPLLIVGGIFAIIFSIPYIKRGFENLFATAKMPLTAVLNIIETIVLSEAFTIHHDIPFGINGIEYLSISFNRLLLYLPIFK